MQKSIKRVVEKSSQPYFHSDLRYTSDFEMLGTSRHSRTSKENFKALSSTRLELVKSSSEDDLTNEEIADINAFRSSNEKPIKFTNVNEFLDDLNE